MCRLLADGDTFAVALEDTTGRSDLLHALHRPGEAAAPAAAGTGYFKVLDMKPRTGASLLVDCRHTAVMLEVCTASLASHPCLWVSMKRYGFARTGTVCNVPGGAKECLWHQSGRRCVFLKGLTGAHVACVKARRRQPMHSAQGSCSGALPVGMPAYRRARLVPTPAAGGLAAPQAATGRQRMEDLGDDPAAAWREPAQLPHAGALLPAWRRLAELLAPVLHPVRGMLTTCVERCPSPATCLNLPAVPAC